MFKIDEKNLKKIIQWFNKKEENLEGKEELILLTIPQLKVIFNISDDYDFYMVYSYSIKEAHIKYLQPYLKHQINLNKYDYFISTYRRE